METACRQRCSGSGWLITRHYPLAVAGATQRIHWCSCNGGPAAAVAFGNSRPKLLPKHLPPCSPEYQHSIRLQTSRTSSRHPGSTVTLALHDDVPCTRLRSALLVGPVVCGPTAEAREGLVPHAARHAPLTCCCLRQQRDTRRGAERHQARRAPARARRRCSCCPG